MAFPLNPVNGQSVTINGIIWTYNTVKGVWNVRSTASASIPVNLTSNIVTTANITANYFIGNGSALTGISAINNGTSNVVVTNNGNVTVGSTGNAAILTVTGTGANISGTLNATGNANVNNLGVGTVIATTANATTLNATTAVITTGNVTTINSGLMQNGNSNVSVASNGNVTIAVTSATRATFSTTDLQITTNLIPSVSATNNLGSATLKWANIYGVASSAQYADLAEKYHSDAVYPAGTVMALGGENEVTQSAKDLDNNVFGVVSTNPAYLMNDSKDDPLWLPIVLTGRAYVNVVGTVSKGGWLVSAGNGLARAVTSEEEIKFNLVIGRSLANKTINTPAPVEAYICTK